MGPDALPELTEEQMQIALGVGWRLARNLPETGVIGREDVQQLAVEAMLTLLASGAALESPRYLGRQIRNRTIDALRREGVLTRVKNEEDAGRHYENPERATLDGLEPRQREILTMSFEEDLAPRQIAERSGVSVRSVYLQKGKALHILRGKLSDRELEVLVEAANGLTTGETAAKLGLSTETIKDRRKTVMKILSARGMANAVAIAFQRGILR